MKPLGVIRDVLDRAVETGVPFVVRKRCTPHQQAAWQAIRFLMDVTERTAFGSREIAHEMGTRAYPRVSGWIAELVELGLLQIVGHEVVNGGKSDRAVYRIPWEAILERSSAEAQVYLAKLGTRFQDKRPMQHHESQLEMDLTVIDGSHGPLPIGNTDRDRSITEPLPMDHGRVTDGSHGPLPIGNTAVIDRSRWMEGRMEGGREGSRARASRKTLADLPPDIGPPPLPPSGEPPIAAHPIDLWRDACPDPRTMDLRQLAQLAVAHNESTSGHGLYWVGRAILAAALTEDVYSIAKIKKILDRWRASNAYGSDTPAYERRKTKSDGRQDSANSAERPAHVPRDAGGSGKSRTRPDAADTRDRAPGAAPPERGPIRTTLDY